MIEAKISLIAACSENGVIGRDGRLPWRMKSDLSFFKKMTSGKPVIMGRKTYESIGKPLPGRTNIVVTRRGDFEAEGVLVVHGLERALRIADIDAQKTGADEICIIGGGEVYAEALPRAERIYLTVVETEIEGDTTFPKLDREQWKVREAGRIEKDADNDHPGRVEIWQRVG